MQFHPFSLILVGLLVVGPPVLVLAAGSPLTACLARLAGGFATPADCSVRRERPTAGFVTPAAFGPFLL
jgi:hypothetical protein